MPITYKASIVLPTLKRACIDITFWLRNLFRLHQTQSGKSMEYNLFGRTGVYVSQLVLGCMMFGQKTDLDDTCKIIDHALGEGINFLDTADVYGRGASEEFVGEALQRNGKRASVFLATKVNGRMSDEPNAIGNSRLHIIEGCEASLRRLKTDHIDLYQLHRPSPPHCD